MGFEEADLMFSVYRRSIGVIMHDTEVVPHRPLVDCCGGLRDQFRAAHSLAVPEGGAVQAELGTLRAACICGVLV